ncbi:MAG: HAD family hydrolase [Candidatus Nanoarchaeia archaeon]
MKKGSKKLICFDMDNTLIDADKLHILAFNKAFKKNNLKPVKATKLKRQFGKLGILIVKELFPKLTYKQAFKVLMDHDYYVYTETKKYAKPFKGIRQTLKKLKKDYKLGIISNCRHREIVEILNAAKLDKKLFKILIGNDDVEHGKPWPDEILKAEKLGHVKAAYMVGDSIYDMIAGKKAKVKTIAVLTGNYTRKELQKYKPDYILKSVNDIPRVIKNG